MNGMNGSNGINGINGTNVINGMNGMNSINGMNGINSALQVGSMSKRTSLFGPSVLVSMTNLCSHLVCHYIE